MNDRTWQLIEPVFNDAYDRLVNFVTGQLDSRAAAEDVVNDAYLRLTASLDAGKHRDPSPAGMEKMLWTTVRRLAHDARERVTRETPVDPLSVVSMIDATTETRTDTGIEAAEFRADFDLAVRRLPREERDCYILCHLRGTSQQEAAQILTIPRRTVTDRLERARLMLSRELT